MKVLHLSGQLGSGGAPRVCYQAVRHLPADVEVTVAYLGGRDGLVEKFERDDIPVVRLGERPLSIASARALDRHLREHQYDLVHTHMISAGLIGRPLAKLRGIPVIHTVHTNYAMRPTKAKAPDVLSAPFGDLAVCVSDSVSQSLPRYYWSDTDVVYNCIDIEDVRAAGGVPWEDLEWTTGLDPDGPIVANVARFDPKKRRVDLIDSVPVVVEEIPDVQFVVTGRKGVRQQQLEARARDLGVAENVHFIGFVENPQSVYRHADVIAIPSEAEGFSIGMLEAMASGRPIIATEIPAFVDALGVDYPGYVSPHHPKELGEEIRRQLTDASLTEALQDIISNRIRHFSGGGAADAYYDLYTNIISN